MNRIIIKTSELLHINEAAKALKQKEFQIFDQFIIGVDNSATMQYVQLDSNVFINNHRFENIVINARDLSAFIKTITLESEFELEYYEDKGFTIRSMNNELWFKKSFLTNLYCDNIINTFYKVQFMIQHGAIQPEADVTNDLSQLFSIKKGDGSIRYNYLGRYMVTLFSGLLPLNKSDRIFLSIYSNSAYAFNALFRVKKKKFDVFICVAYLFI